ncbi:hypothetical protein SDC9_140498 [bioreactor metagenome]|uniref:Uncharacterized protein n=1 Tax=bioreactor metagenome TaxID=1076179 RepID=A0A645DVK3_9ZZZZ
MNLTLQSSTPLRIITLTKQPIRIPILHHTRWNLLPSNCPIPVAPATPLPAGTPQAIIRELLSPKFHMAVPEQRPSMRNGRPTPIPYPSTAMTKPSRIPMIKPSYLGMPMQISPLQPKPIMDIRGTQYRMEAEPRSAMPHLFQLQRTTPSMRSGLQPHIRLPTHSTMGRTMRPTRLATRLRPTPLPSKILHVRDTPSEVGIPSLHSLRKSPPLQRVRTTTSPCMPSGQRIPIP